MKNFKFAMLIAAVALAAGVAVSGAHDTSNKVTENSIPSGCYGIETYALAGKQKIVYLSNLGCAEFIVHSPQAAKLSPLQDVEKL